MKNLSTLTGDGRRKPKDQKLQKKSYSRFDAENFAVLAATRIDFFYQAKSLQVNQS